MTNTLDITPTSRSGIRAITGNWGWFVALGIAELVLGGVASTNLLLANLASVLLFGAATLAGGILQIAHAFSARGLPMRSELLAMISACASSKRRNLLWRGAGPESSSRAVAEETAVALTYCGSTYAVMMATPADLQDFGVGFSMTEGIIEQVDEIRSVDLLYSNLGIEVRMWLDEHRARSLTTRRRAIVGPVGCGLCGIESLEQASRTVRQVTTDTEFQARDLLNAMRALAPLQRLNRQTRAVHAAAFWQASSGVGPVREDVGRHNALDKLAGALIRERRSVSDGAVLLTSRVSVEMIQKTAMIGVPVVIAVSAPTTLAIRTADEAGITLIAIARDDGYEVFTHPDRIVFPTDMGWRFIPSDHVLPTL